MRVCARAFSFVVAARGSICMPLFPTACQSHPTFCLDRKLAIVAVAACGWKQCISAHGTGDVASPPIRSARASQEPAPVPRGGRSRARCGLRKIDGIRTLARQNLRGDFVPRRSSGSHPGRRPSRSSSEGRSPGISAAPRVLFFGGLQCSAQRAKSSPDCPSRAEGHATIPCANFVTISLAIEPTPNTWTCPPLLGRIAASAAHVVSDMDAVAHHPERGSCAC